MEMTEQIIDLFNFKNGRELTQLYLKSDDFLLACVLRKSKQCQLMNLESIHYIMLLCPVIHGNVDWKKLV